MPSRQQTSGNSGNHRNKQAGNRRRKTAAGPPLVVVVNPGGEQKENKRGLKRKFAKNSGTSDSKEKSVIKCCIEVYKSPEADENLGATEEFPNGDLEDPDWIPESRPSLILKAPNMQSRTVFKQQLMREHTQQLLEKEKVLSLSSTAQPASTSEVPVPSVPAVSVPKQVLVVKSKLKYPSVYHVKRCQERQVHEYLSQSHHSGGITFPECTTDSPEPSSTVSFSADTSGHESPLDLEEFWQDLKNLQGNTTSMADSGVEPGFNIASTTTDAAILEVFSMLPDIEGASMSCPVGLDEDGLLNDQKLRAFEKDRLKKDQHNIIERRRRFNINDRIKELGALLPQNDDPHYDLVKAVRRSKGMILKSTVNYVKVLKNEVKRIPQLEAACRNSAQESKKLRLRIRELEAQLKAHDLPVSNSTWYPSSESDLNAIIKQEPVPVSLYMGCALTTNQPTLSSLALNTCEEKLPEDAYFSTVKGAQNAPCHGNRTGYPILQFLRVKETSASHATPPSSSTPSPGPNCSSPMPVVAQFEDLMMDDDQPLTHDTMLSSTESFTPDHMDFSLS